MVELRQRLALIHELRELRRCKEFTHRGSDRAAVDKLHRGDGLEIHDRHAVFHDTLGSHETHAVLVLHEFSDATDTAIAEVIDIIGNSFTVIEANEFAEDFQEIFHLEHSVAFVGLGFHVEPAVHFVTGDVAHVVLLEVKKESIHELLGILGGREISGANLAVDTLIGILESTRRVLAEGRENMVLLLGHVLEEIKNFVVRFETEDPEKLRDRNFPFAVDLAGDNPTAIRLDFQPHAAFRNDFGRVMTRIFRHFCEEHARATNQLVHDDALDATDDERADIGHEWNRAEEHILLFDFSGLLIDELHVPLHDRLVREVAVTAGIGVVFRRIEGVTEDAEFHFASREVRDRRDFLEKFFDAFREEPLVAEELHFDE